MSASQFFSEKKTPCISGVRIYNVQTETTNIKSLLLERIEQRKQKEKEEKLKKESETSNLLFEREGGKQTENLRKKEVDEMTEKEMDVMDSRIKLQQQEFEKHNLRQERNKILKILSFLHYLDQKEAEVALTDCKGEEDDAILRFSDSNDNYLYQIRKKIAESSPSQYSNNSKKKRARSTASRTTGKLAREKMGTYVRTRLRLNDAMEQLDKCDNLEEAMKDWSPARIKAYMGRKENPNAYYYRFNDPGEKQKNGRWDAGEEKCFFRRLEELGANGQWGIFSMTIPGRVGYQCSNFYRKLLKEGRINDDNYFFDDDGKSHYKFKGKDGKEYQKTFKRKNADDSSADSPAASTKPKPAPKARASSSKRGSAKKRKSRDPDDIFSDEEDTGRWQPDRSHYTTKRLRLKHGELNEDDLAETPNPLPGFTDPVTLDEVVMPAISPAGQVMSYSSWSQCIEHNGLCPLTKQPVTLKELVVLTPKNIEQYRDKIINHM